MGNFIFGMLNTIIKALGVCISAVIALLPTSPFQFTFNGINEIDSEFFSTVMGALNWLFPIAEAIAILEVWVVAIGIYYVYSLVLRWAKAIE